jgi:uncharacterized membrane protein
MRSERVGSIYARRPPAPRADVLLRIVSLVATILTGAIFGFFYAWVCSTMWGLDSIDPRVAIAAMQAMNASVRNAVFFPAFFLTPAVLGLAAALAWTSSQHRCAAYFAASAVIYLVGGLLLTALVNVPMNEALGTLAVPESAARAREIWSAYSAPWQAWNLTRTLASGTSLVLASLALIHLDARRTSAGRHP